jgi:hypothetical protein
MPFSRIADPEQAEILNSALEELCHDAGIRPATPERREAASLIMRLYWCGHRTPDELRSAINIALGRESANTAGMAQQSDGLEG